MRKSTARLLALLSLIGAVLLLRSPAALAQATPTSTAVSSPNPALTPTPTQLSATESEEHGDTNCLMCHFDPDFTGHPEDGSTVSLYIEPGVFYRSVHAEAGLECLACHVDQKGYPHQASGQVTCQDCHEDLDTTQDAQYRPISVELNYADKRSITLALNENCRACHEENFEESVDSAHVRVQVGGNRNAPVCVDCHGSHDITSPNEPRIKISQTCATCHLAVYSTYQASIHGTALETDSNPDVPACVDCHGVHNVRGPRDVDFHNDMIAVCGGCHADEDRMEKYEISTNVFDTYLDDFHGRTVNFFRNTDNNIPSNKATCFDCHGIHNIRPADDPSSTVYPHNLQATCQQCHADAGIAFPQAWLSHYVPTWEDTPALFAVNTIYSYMIPGVIGSFLVYIGLDARRRLSNHRRSSKQQYLELELGEERTESTDDKE
ncbi:MAG: cytochrome c3 family protein [Chloroflexota bacterium]